MSLDAYHRTRFAFDPRRDLLWRTLCERFFSPLLPADAVVLELGAGHGHFINHIRCSRRFALDAWPGFVEHLQAGVIARVGPATDLDFVPDAAIDFAFASNLFEHLTQDELAQVLAGLRRKLRAGGTLNVLQPNYRFAYREYYDDYTHVTVYSDRSLCDFLGAHGFEVFDCRPRFLPLTIKSRWPVSPWLIRAYLASPFKPLAKQMFLRARPTS
jgi:SAM-dependent methyltransferase